MMVDEISNKTLAVLLIVAIAISLGGTLVSINRISSGRWLLPGGITGYVSNTGTTNVTIASTASIRFAKNNLDFGIGAVNSSAGNQVCSLFSNSSGGGKDSITKCINFSAAGSMASLSIENDGTVNLTVNITSTQNAAGFIGGPSGLERFQYKVTNNETNACALPIPATWTNVTIVASGQNLACNSTGGLGFVVAANALNLDFNVTVPYDSLKAGAVNQVVTITAIGTVVP